MKTVKRCCIVLSLMICCIASLKAQLSITPAPSTNNQHCYNVTYTANQVVDNIVISIAGESISCSNTSSCSGTLCFDRPPFNPRTGEVICSVTANGVEIFRNICIVTIWPRRHMIAPDECTNLGIIANCGFASYCHAGSADPANISHLTVGVYYDDIIMDNSDVTPIAWANMSANVDWYDKNTGALLHSGAWVEYNPAIEYRVEVTRWHTGGTTYLCTDEQWWDGNGTGSALAATDNTPSSSAVRAGTPTSSVIKVDSPVNYPNPFHNQTTISFELEKDATVTLAITDISGRQIASLLNKDGLHKGTHQVVFDRNRYPAGIYYYTIQADNEIKTYRMTILR